MRAAWVPLLALLPSAAAAQAPSARTAAPSDRIPPAAEQVAAAVLPLPEEMRAGATVLGYDARGALVLLRRGTNGMTCLADDPGADQWHVACYHESLEPFMARGRSLRAEGVTGAQVDTVRFREIADGRLRMPAGPASLYSLTGPPGSFDPVTGKANGARRLYVVYIPFATEATTGLSTRPKQGEPWLMFPGTPKAHIMFTATM